MKYRVLLIVALIATWGGFSQYSAGGGVDAAGATKDTGVDTEVPHLPEGTGQDGEPFPMTDAAAAAFAHRRRTQPQFRRGGGILQSASMCPASSCLLVELRGTTGCLDSR